MIKVNLDQHKTALINVEIDGVMHEVMIRSLLERVAMEAQAEYYETLSYAQENNILLQEEVEKDLGLGLIKKVKQQTEFFRKAYAILISKLVVDYPTDGLLTDIYENKDLATMIDLTSSKLKNEFEAKKKT